MAMHAVLGDGQMTRKELTETLVDLEKADAKEEQTFWFLLLGKAEPTDTDKALVNWLHANDIYYEIVTDDADSVNDLYAQPQEVHVAKGLPKKVVSLLQSRPEEGEPAELLALFAGDPGDPVDRWLNTVIQAVFEAEIPIRALNDGLADIDLGSTPAPAAAEEEPVASAPKKAVAKKAAARPLKAVPDGDTEVPEDLTREQLEELDLEQLKEIAAARGIELPARTRMTTYIDKILGEGKDQPPVAEVGTVTVGLEEIGGEPHINGDIDIQALASAVVDTLIQRLVEVLS